MSGRGYCESILQGAIHCIAITGREDGNLLAWGYKVKDVTFIYHGRETNDRTNSLNYCRKGLISSSHPIWSNDG